MAVAVFVGYLHYSDRPGLGWYQKHLGISCDEIGYIRSFIRFVGIYILGTLFVIYLAFRLFCLIGYNRVLYSVTAFYNQFKIH